MALGFVCLIAIVDWFSRRVLAWRLSITLTTDFCIEALEEALARFGALEIFNTDQGSQGGFNRSSQHHAAGGWDEGLWSGIGSEYAEEVTFAWAPTSLAEGEPLWVLVRHCSGTLERRSGRRCRGFASGRGSLVSELRRNATNSFFIVGEPPDRSLPYICGTRRHRYRDGQRHWHPCHCAQARSLAKHCLSGAAA
jgi:hypothetical protein